MKKEDYIVIQSWMVSELGLSGNELLIFALIHGFCKDGEHEFRGSIDYIRKWTGLSKPSVIRILKELVSKDLIKKKEENVKNVKVCSYSMGGKIILPVVKKFNQGGNKILPGGGKKTLPNNTNIDNIKEKDITSTEGVVAEANDGQNAMINALVEQNELLKRQIEELTKKPKRKKKDPDPAFSEAKNIFTSKYKSLFGQDYYWQAKDAGCMTKLLSQIRFSRKSKGLSDDVEGVIEGLKKFLDYIKDDFILNHFDVSMLVSQYNSIMTGQKAQRGELTGQVLRRERGEYNEKNFFEI